MSSIQDYVRMNLGTSSASDMAKSHHVDLGDCTTIILQGYAPIHSKDNGSYITADQAALQSLAQQALDQRCAFVADIQAGSLSTSSMMVSYLGTGYIVRK
ncbi:hypothetical protein HYT52_04295 [Candidatus Woesearchaeota archaeon]|nr:hypothetical protein [Candidatus Woesearchaeota archaeon]